jgi:hypothetical protein
VGDDHTIRLWDRKTGKQVHRFGEQWADVRSISFSPAQVAKQRPEGWMRG